MVQMKEPVHTSHHEETLATHNLREDTNPKN